MSKKPDKLIKVLAVDDEQIVLDSIRKHLTRVGYTVQCINSAYEALEVLKRVAPDIVLTDLMMPEIDGVEFLQKARKIAPTTPMILITGYATLKTVERAFGAGAFECIAKPFSKSELVAVVDRAAATVTASRTGATIDGSAANPEPADSTEQK